MENTMRLRQETKRKGKRSQIFWIKDQNDL